MRKMDIPTAHSEMRSSFKLKESMGTVLSDSLFESKRTVPIDSPFSVLAGSAAEGLAEHLTEQFVIGKSVPFKDGLEGQIRFYQICSDLGKSQIV